MSPDALKTVLPSFVLEAGNDVPAQNAWATLPWGAAGIRGENYRPAPVFHEEGSVRVCLLGAPILGDAIAVEQVAAQAASRNGDHDWLRSLDGEFLIITADRASGRLTVSTSRFCSPPFFYFSRKGFFAGAFAFRDLFELLAARGELAVNDETFYHLLGYKRVFGHKTHAKGALLAEPASVIVFDGETTRTSRYYRPDFTAKTKMGLADCAAALIENIQGSIRRKISDGARPTLFLSGGMDTRTILGSFAALDRKPVCFTINQFQNREVQVARKLAETVGAPHIYLPFFENHYPRVFDDALRLTGALQHPMCMFMGFTDVVAEHGDVAFHGHGFDYFFQGMYLPADSYTVGGRVLAYRRLRRLKNVTADFFLENISYRIKDYDLGALVRPDHAGRLREGLRAEVDATLREAREITDSPYDALEYLTFYNLARHYTFADHWGINTLLPQRAVSFDNALYAFYQSLRPEIRFDAALMRKALVMLNPSLAGIISANHTYPVKCSSKARTYYQLRNFLLRKLKLQKGWENEEFQRMGLPQAYVLSSSLRPHVEALADSPRLASIPWLDMDGLRAYVRLFLNRPAGVGQLLMSLIAVDHLLAASDAPRT